MIVSDLVNDVLISALLIAKNSKDEFVTPEHVLKSAITFDTVKNAIVKISGDLEGLESDLTEYLLELDKTDFEPEESELFKDLLINASNYALACGKDTIEITHIINSIYELEECYATYFLLKNNIFKEDILYVLSHNNEDLNSNSKIKNIDSSDRSESYLTKYTTCLSTNEELSNYKLIGRSKEINRAIQILLRKEKNNPIFVGEPGVGKTAIANGIVSLINNDNIPSILKDSCVYSIDISRILAGTKYRGDFEERMKGVLDELELLNSPILCIDEIHNLVGAGSLGNGSLDASNILKPYLINNKIKFIGSTTFDDYKKYIQKDKGLTRRFSIIEVKEPNIDESIEILSGLKKEYEDFYSLSFSNEAIESAVRLSNKYIKNRFLPDKALDLLDEAGSRKKLISNDDVSIVSKNDIEDILFETYGIPKSSIEKEEKSALLNLGDDLGKSIFGQDDAIAAIVNAIKISKAGLGEEDKPIGSFLFVGPTGVGKTELSKNLAKCLDMNFIRFDMSEYTERHSAAKLIGTPPGYVGYEEGGLLCDAITKSPNSVLLLDEIEKAHKDVLNVLLGVMDYANLTDNKGNKIDFKNVVIIMTSNAGAREVGKSMVGFGNREKTFTAIDDSVKKIFSPEFRNRLSKIIKFKPLDKNICISIAKKNLELLNSKLKLKGFELAYSNELLDYLSSKGTGYEYGGREITRIIENEIKPLLVDKILFGDATSENIFIEVKNNNIVIK